MVRPLYLYSERFPPGGTIDARSAKRALGRSRYDPWSVFLREVLQNSWDARLQPDGPVSFRVDAWFATRAQLRLLEESVFTELPPHVELDASFRERSLALLMVTDSGTRGLEGPLRADQLTSEHSDFVDFVRNTGRDEGRKGMAGGTYGLGKAVLFNHSVENTVVVFTRTTNNGRPVSRFMAMAVAEPYDDGRRRYTGRHWWGVEDEVTGANPVTGRTAEELARALGIDTIPEGGTGTAIMVLAPAALDEGDWEGRDTLRDVVDRIADAAAWHAWPHMTGSIATPSIHFEFSCEGEALAAPDPRRHPILKHYVRAYRRIVDTLDDGGQARPDPYTVTELRSERPSRRLGMLAYRRYPLEDAVGRPPFGDVDHHVALMRNPRLVVRYLEVSADTDAHAVAGVFVADPELDEKFARSEPVTHDDWVPQRAQDEQYERNPVRQALVKVREAFRPRHGHALAETGIRFPGVTTLAAALGDLFAGQTGGADLSVPVSSGVGGILGHPGGDGGSQGDASGSAKRPLRAAARLLPETRLLVAESGNPAVEFDVDIDVPEGVTVRIYALPRVVLDGGALESPDDAPVDAPVPHVIGWRQRPRGDLSVGDLLTISGVAAEQWAVQVSQPEDTAVSILLRLETEERS